MAFFHGILGRGRNLRTPAKRFVERHADWEAWLVDLRGHGESPKGTPGGSLAAAARDIAELSARTSPPLTALVGHSFGGKVALDAARLGEIKTLKDVVLIDSMPGARAPVREDDSALAIVDILKSLPSSFTSIQEFVAALEGHHLARDLAQWLAGSLTRENNEYRFNLDLNEIQTLALDYFARDLWEVVESPPGNVRLHLVIGSQSDTYSLADRERAIRIAATNPRVFASIVPSGHWVHVDAPDALMAALDQVSVP